MIKMVILLEGLNRIRDLHGDDMTSFKMGTDGTAAAESQTGLQSGVAASELSVTITPAEKANTLSYTLPSTTGTGSTYREGGARNDANSVDYDRIPWTGVAHTSANDIVVKKLYYYRNVE